MPKEITHFALASRLRHRMKSGSLFYEPVRDFPCLFRLGAVAPDIPFFYLAGPHRRAVQALSPYYHRTDSSALKPLLRFLETHGSPAAKALAAGVACHLISDTVFHPMVLYFAGTQGVHSGATGRHRRFETAMDLHFHYLSGQDPYLYRLVRSVEIPRPELNGLLAGLFSGGRVPPRVMGRSLDWFRGIQFLFRNSLVRQAAALCERSSRPLPAAVSGVIYPRSRPLALPFFSGRLRYRHPCTGTEVDTSLSALVKKTVDSTLCLLDHISARLAGGGRVSRIRAGSPGLPRVQPDLPPEAVRFWQGDPALGPILYQGLPPKDRPRF